MSAQKKARYYVRPLATHPTAPPRFSSIDHGHQPKKRYLETDETRSNKAKNASQMRQWSSLGDWNAGKEDDSLPGPNFDVPRDLFRGATVIIPSCRLPAGASSIESRMLP